MGWPGRSVPFWSLPAFPLAVATWLGLGRDSRLRAGVAAMAVTLIWAGLGLAALDKILYLIPAGRQRQVAIVLRAFPFTTTALVLWALIRWDRRSIAV